MTDNAENSEPNGAPEGEKPPLEQLLELLVYAPVGLLYEHQDILPKLVRRGKSQVQLAKVMSQMAAKQGQNKAKETGLDPEQMLAEVLGQAATVLAKGLTEIGQVVGLAPTDSDLGHGTATDQRDDGSNDSAAEKLDASRDAGPLKSETPDDSGVADDSPVAQALLVPIAGYDTLKARDVVPLLNELSEDQRDRVRAYEAATRGRKTILAKLDKLSS